MGQKVLITGGSRGIGKAIALHLGAQGFELAITYRKEEAQALAVAAAVEESGGRCHCIQGDFSQEEESQEAVLQALTLLKGLDGVVCNVGQSHMGLLQDMTGAQWRQLMATNLDSMFYTLKPLLSHFISQKYGSIITVSSMWGQVGASCEVAYSASKGGVIAFTKALAQELGPSGVLVNCVAPGVIGTEMIDCLTEEDKICLKEETPLGRIGTGEEVAEVVDFLLSTKSRFLTGQVLSPNGGLVM